MGGLHALAHVEVLTAPEVVEALVGYDRLAVLRGTAGGHEARAVRSLGAVRRVVRILGGDLRPPVPGEFHPVVPADDVVQAGLEAAGGEAVGHALHLLDVFLWNLVLVQFDRLIDEERVIHAKRLERHMRVDANGVLKLVGEQVAVLEADLVRASLNGQVLPSVDPRERGLVHDLLLFAGQCHCIPFVGTKQQHREPETRPHFVYP